MNFSAANRCRPSRHRVAPKTARICPARKEFNATLECPCRAVPTKRRRCWDYATIGLDAGSLSNVAAVMLQADARARRRFVLVAAAVFLTVVATACGSSAVNATPPTIGVTQPNPGATTITTTTTQPTLNSAGPLPNRWTYSGPGPLGNGYSQSVTFAAGSLQHYTPDLTNNGFIAGTKCTINQNTDAVIPFEVIMTNTTPSFSIPVIEMNMMKLPGSSITNSEDAVEGGCQPITGVIIGVNASNLAPGASSTDYGFFVVSNDYSPNYPNGDPNALQNATLEMSGRNINQSPLSGPGCPCSADQFNLAGLPQSQ
jgi:hypothetical protein